MKKAEEIAMQKLIHSINNYDVSFSIENQILTIQAFCNLTDNVMFIKINDEKIQQLSNKFFETTQQFVDAVDYAIKNPSKDISVHINDNSMLSYDFELQIPIKRTYKIDVQLEIMEQDPLARLEGKVIKLTN